MCLAVKDCIIGVLRFITDFCNMQGSPCVNISFRGKYSAYSHLLNAGFLIG
jgi:hypothetical protein